MSVKTFWKSALVRPADTIGRAIAIIDSAVTQVALVVDEAGKLLATVTDGDIRRALLRGLTLADPISQAMNSKYHSLPMGAPRAELFAYMRQHRIRRLPLIDGGGILCDLIFLEAWSDPAKRPNWAVVMAGGLGTRLKPYTEYFPKPLLRVGNKPILTTLLEQLAEQGFEQAWISVNYKSSMIKKCVGNGDQLGLKIRYLEEKSRLGSGGALSLLPEAPSAPFLVLNADLLTKVDYGKLIDYHVDHRAAATMCVKEYEFQVPYGVVKMEGNRLLEMEEKPIFKFFVNAGIYVFEPWALGLVPKGEQFDMPTLLTKIRERNEGDVALFPIREYWLDIGKKADFAKANREIESLETE
jgi:dTDP-glucose pyrophosphorylase